MNVISDDEICLTYESAIYKFVIISILLNQSKTEIGVFANNVPGACNDLHKQVSSRW